jgi:selenium-binding protein 1
VPLKPDPTFYPSPAIAAEGPAEKLACVVTLNTGTNGDQRPDALAVTDVDPESSAYGTTVGRLDMPNVGDELHHFGWNACSSALCPWAPHPHVERRYLLIPGLRSSRIHVVDVKDDPVNPKLTKVIEAEELHHRTGYSRPHTVHCGPDGSTSPLWATRRATARAACCCSTTTTSVRPGAGRSSAARRTWRTTCGGTSATTPC